MMKLPSFDEMKEMAKDPEAFEEFRRQTIEEYIASMPEEKQEKLRAQQWRLDKDLKKIKNQQVRMSIVYAMMVDSLNKLNLMLNDPDEYDRLFAKPVTKCSVNKVVSINRDKDDG